MAPWVTEKRSEISKKNFWGEKLCGALGDRETLRGKREKLLEKSTVALRGGGTGVPTLLHQSIYICLHIINSKTRSNRKVISSFIIELPSPDVTSIEMNADAYCIYSQSLIPNTKDSTLWESSDNYDGTRRLETYRAVAKSKGVAGKLEAMIFLRNLV